MNKETANEFITYLEKQITACKEQEEKLKKDNRTDERIFAKICGNVYDISKTIFSVAGKGGQKGITQEQFFLDKLVQLTDSWQAAYEKAMVHNDVEKMQVEHIKLDAANKIRTQFLILTEKKA